MKRVITATCAVWEEVLAVAQLPPVEGGVLDGFRAALKPRKAKPTAAVEVDAGGVQGLSSEVMATAWELAGGTARV